MHEIHSSTQEIMDEILSVRLSDLEREEQLCLKLLEVEDARNPYVQAFAYTFLCDFCLAMRQNISAYEYNKKAMKIARIHDYRKLLARIYRYAAMCYDAFFDDQTAMDFYLQAVQLSIECHDTTNESATLNNIAQVFEKNEDIENASSYYKKSYNVLIEDENNDDLYSRAVCLANMIGISNQLRNVKEAESYLEDFKLIMKDVDEPVILFLYHYAIISNLLTKKNYDEGIKKIDELLIEQERLSDRFLSYQVLLNICVTLIEIGDYERSIKVLEIIDETNQEDDIKLRRETQTMKIEFYEKFHMKDKLYDAYHEFFDIEVAINRTDHMNKASGLRAKIELYEARSKEKKMEKEKANLEAIINMDVLVNCFNRRFLDSFLDHDWKDDSFNSIGIAMLDIDYFKEYNDCYGHAKGDDILIRAVESMRSFMDQRMYICRYGGDEFSCIFLDHTKDEIEQYLKHVLEDIRRQKIHNSDSKISEYLTMSAGYALCADKNSIKLSDILDQADQALYEAKNQGRDCIAYYKS